MTRNVHTEYLDLISSLKNYIAQEYPPTTSVVADPETFNYFKMQAQQARAAAPQKTAPLPPPKAPQNTTRSPALNLEKTIAPAPIAVSSLSPIKPVTEPETSVKQAPLVLEPPKGPEVQPVEKPKLSPLLKREALEASKSNDFSDLCKLWQENCPHTPILMEVPSDAQAKIISSRWQHPPRIPEIILLHFNKNPHEMAFLTNVAAAISQYFAPAGLIAAAKVESEKKWNKLLSTPSLKLIIAHHHSLYTLPELTQQYCEDPVRGNHTLGRVPLLLLSDLSLYMQQPKLKIALWQTLCQRFGAKR